MNRDSWMQRFRLLAMYFVRVVCYFSRKCASVLMSLGWKEVKCTVEHCVTPMSLFAQKIHPPHHGIVKLRVPDQTSNWKGLTEIRVQDSPSTNG